jgi:hypothetical protein
MAHKFSATEANPEGIVSSSPGLRGTSYPGKTVPGTANPNGVVAGDEARWSQPRWG